MKSNIIPFKRPHIVKRANLDVSRWDTAFDIAEELLEATKQLRSKNRLIRCLSEQVELYKALGDKNDELITLLQQRLEARS